MNPNSAARVTGPAMHLSHEVNPPLTANPELVKFIRGEGSHYHGEYAPERYDPQLARRLYQEITEEIVEAEALGWDGVLFTEHHYDAYSVTPSPNLLMTHVAAKTSKIRIGTGVYILPNYDPVRLAEEVGMLDVLSGGRMEVGVGRGNFQFELDRFSFAQEDMPVRFDENVEVFTKAIRSIGFTHDGRWTKVRVPTTVYPKPMQKNLPIWYGAMSPGSVERAGRLGMNLASVGIPDNCERLERYIEASRKIDREVSGGNYMLVTSMVVAPTDAEAERIAERVSRDMAPALEQRVKAQPGLANVLNRVAIFGSPQTVRDKFAHLIEHTGARRFMIVVRMLGVDTQLVRQSQRLFMEEVAPHLRHFKV